MATANISSVEKAKSERFMKSLNKIMEVLEIVSQKIPENDYLECMNELKNLYDFNTENPIQEIIQELNNNEIVETHNRRTKMKVLIKKPAKKKEICEYCDCKIRIGGMSEHHKTKKCQVIQKTKLLSALSHKEETKDICIMRQHLKFLFKKMDYKALINEWKTNSSI
tara:strand:- start:28 stop:528 length:501 start_codon:yes stop_codon:yes gene_type:complete